MILGFYKRTEKLFLSLKKTMALNQLKSYKSEMSVKEYWSLPSGCCKIDFKIRLVFGSMM